MSPSGPGRGPGRFQRSTTHNAVCQTQGFVEHKRGGTREGITQGRLEREWHEGCANVDEAMLTRYENKKKKTPTANLTSNRKKKKNPTKKPLTFHDEGDWLVQRGYEGGTEGGPRVRGSEVIPKLKNL